MHAYTSITANYLPKARVLAASLKRFHPEAQFHLLLADSLSGIPARDLREFDSILTVDDLPIPERRAWAFQHSVVELCTAIKGVGAQEVLRQTGGQRLFYFDPDIAILSRLDGLLAYLNRHSLILTPHLCVPEEESAAVMDNEICAMRHGIYNLGFLGVRVCPEGLRFLDWWTERLMCFCYDDIPAGLFTDQRWADLAPAFFPGLGIVRDPEYNVATWNLSHRQAIGTAPHGIIVEGRPLCFFHFSGFDSGAQEIMLNLYGAASPVLFDLRRWYLEECERMGQSRYEGRPGIYDYFSDGTRVAKEQRLLYRTRSDLRAAFPEPFAVENVNHSFRHWYESNVAAPSRSQEAEEAARAALAQTREARLAAQADELAAQRVRLNRLESLLIEKDNQLAAIRSSRSWRLVRALSQSWNGLKSLRLRPAYRA